MKILFFMMATWLVVLSAVIGFTLAESPDLRDWRPALNILIWPVLAMLVVFGVIALILEALMDTFGAESSFRSRSACGPIKIIGAVLLAALIAALSYYVSAFLI